MSELADLHQALARVVLVDRNLREVLNEITEVAHRALPGAEAVSITLIRDERPFTAAYSGQMALDADELQYERGYGPCVDAGRAGQTFLVEDMRTEQRWPDYARHAADQGVNSSLSIPLPFQNALIGALNVYSARPHAFGETEVVLGEEVTNWVALAVGNAEGTARTGEQLAQLRTAMATRGTIEQAKGILMERHKINADEAFTLLTHASQTTNTKLRDVAAELVRTGVLVTRAR